jgi:nucleoside-diphosphate-sugar epimerase
MDVYRAYGRMHGSEPGPIEPMPLTEEAPLRERLFPYRGERARADLDEYDKIPVERLVMSDERVKGSVIRLPAVHGEHDYQRRLFMEVRRFEAGRPFLLMAQESPSWRWARSYVANAAHAIALVTTSARAIGRVYHVADIDGPTQEEYVRTCAEIAGWHGEIIFAPNAELPTHLRSNVNFAQDIVADSTRIREELAYAEAVSPREGLARAMAWEREHPPRKMPQHLLDFEAEDAWVARLRSERT